MKVSIEQAIATVTAASSVTFLTGAGVSTPSGIPDYRSLKGVYQGLAQPEYLLSHDCLENEPETLSVRQAPLPSSGPAEHHSSKNGCAANEKNSLGRFTKHRWTA